MRFSTCRIQSWAWNTSSWQSLYKKSLIKNFLTHKPYPSSSHKNLQQISSKINKKLVVKSSFLLKEILSNCLQTLQLPVTTTHSTTTSHIIHLTSSLNKTHGISTKFTLTQALDSPLSGYRKVV